MARFDSFQFLKDRALSIQPTEEQLDAFDLYMTQMALSMVKSHKHLCQKTNNHNFFALPKSIQCMAFTSLNGSHLYGKWMNAKKSSSKEREDNIEKVMKVYDCSRNEATSFLANKIIDLEKLEDLYLRIYAPNEIKFRAKK